jgi:CubicO group peptidase (beta-lactamase class C family)
VTESGDETQRAGAAPLRRRGLLKGLTAAGLATAGGRGSLRPAGAAPDPGGAGALDWAQFDRAVRAALATFGVAGAAVAVVNAAGVVHQATFGVRDLAGRAPVTPDTLFRVGSTTKSMTALLVATFVDDGTLAWDQPVRAVWPAFRAPTDELTATLRVRDLLGMDSGLGAPIATDLDQSYPTAQNLVQSLATLPVLGPPGTTYYYNNTVCSVAGYLPALARGAAPDELSGAYARSMQERVFGPAGMRRARIGDDPRPFADDFATGSALDLVQGPVAEPFVPVGSFAPVGAALASLTDMAAHVSTQLGGGTAPGGRRVVSARTLAECWRPHIDLPIPESTAPLAPDVVRAGYAMGWISETFRDGRRIVWHNGAVDGFTSYIGFLPEDDLGLVVLNNSWTSPGGVLFYTYVLNLLLREAFGLNAGAGEAAVAAYGEATRQLAGLAAQAVPVDAAALTPYLGSYERGYGVHLDAAGVPRLRLSTRALRLLPLGAGGYVIASGLLAGVGVRFSRDATGIPLLTLEEIETVRWLSGPA